MRNKYKGTCNLCLKEVEVGAGHFQRAYGKWLTKHFECVLEDRKIKAEVKTVPQYRND